MGFTGVAELVVYSGFVLDQSVTGEYIPQALSGDYFLFSGSCFLGIGIHF